MHLNLGYYCAWKHQCVRWELRKLRDIAMINTQIVVKLIYASNEPGSFDLHPKGFYISCEDIKAYIYVVGYYCMYFSGKDERCRTK